MDTYWTFSWSWFHQRRIYSEKQNRYSNNRSHDIIINTRIDAISGRPRHSFRTPSSRWITCRRDCPSGISLHMCRLRGLAIRSTQNGITLWSGTCYILPNNLWPTVSSVEGQPLVYPSGHSSMCASWISIVSFRLKLEVKQRPQIQCTSRITNTSFGP